MKRAVVTGIGVVAPTGIGTSTYWEATQQGKSGIARITHFDPSQYPTQFAGEVKGPPGQPCDTSVVGDCVHNTNTTGALDHANSACAASGLNDMDPNDPGQTSSQVQTAADSWKYYGLPKGAVGEACRGGGPKDR